MALNENSKLFPKIPVKMITAIYVVVDYPVKLENGVTESREFDVAKLHPRADDDLIADTVGDGIFRTKAMGAEKVGEEVIPVVLDIGDCRLARGNQPKWLKQVQRVALLMEGKFDEVEEDEDEEDENEDEDDGDDGRSNRRVDSDDRRDRSEPRSSREGEDRRMNGGSRDDGRYRDPGRESSDYRESWGRQADSPKESFLERQLIAAQKDALELRQQVFNLAQKQSAEATTRSAGPDPQLGSMQDTIGMLRRQIIEMEDQIRNARNSGWKAVDEERARMTELQDRFLLLRQKKEELEADVSKLRLELQEARSSANSSAPPATDEQKFMAKANALGGLLQSASPYVMPVISRLMGGAGQQDPSQNGGQSGPGTSDGSPGGGGAG